MSPDIGEFIKGLRENARISLRQLADQAGVSNPYLSQIERGLRKPSAEVLAQIAGALRVSTPAMYLRAGLLGTEDGPGVLSSIAADPVLTVAQKQSLTQIYETFMRENARNEFAEPTAGPEEPVPAKAVGRAEPTVDAEPKAGATAEASDKRGKSVKPAGTERAAGAKATAATGARTRNTAGGKRGTKRADSTKTADNSENAFTQEDKS